MAGEWPQRGEGRSRVGDPSGRLSVRVLFSFSRVSVLGDQAKQSVFLVGDSGREINSVAEDQHIPQPIKLEGSAIGSVNCSQEGAGHGIVIVDDSVTKISDP